MNSVLLYFLFVYSTVCINSRSLPNFNKPPAAAYLDHPIPNYYPQQPENRGCRDSNFNLQFNQPKPDFFLIGANKAGTTSFMQYFNEHPNIESKTIEIKEPSFFSGFGFFSPISYQSLFVNIAPVRAENGTIPKNRVLSGDYSTSYLPHPLAPRRLFQQMPTAKLIFILRNPIDRAYSQYIMGLRNNIEELPFETVIANELSEIDEVRFRFRECFNNDECSISYCFPRTPIHNHDVNASLYTIRKELDLHYYLERSYLFRSIYDDQMERWFSIFQKRQMLFLTAEELYNNPAKVMEKAARWLQLPYYNFSSSAVIKRSWGGGASNAFEAGSYEPMRPGTRKILRDFFEPYNQRLYALIGRNLG